MPEEEKAWYATAELSDTEPESWMFLGSGLCTASNVLSIV